MINKWRGVDEPLGVKVSDGVLEVQTMSYCRWLPRNGDPVTTMEKIVHRVIKVIAWLPVYTAIVVTLTLYVLVFGLPFLGR